MDRQASSGPDTNETRWKTIRGRVFFWLGVGEGAGELATCVFCPFIQRYMGRALRLGPFFRNFCQIDRRRRRRSRFRVGNRQVISKKKVSPYDKYLYLHCRSLYFTDTCTYVCSFVHFGVGQACCLGHQDPSTTFFSGRLLFGPDSCTIIMYIH